MIDIALVQLAIQDGRPHENFLRAKELISAHPGADVYLLPELWTTGYVHKDWRRLATEATPTIVEQLSGLSGETGAAIGGSMISVRDDGRLANRFWWMDGDQTAWYDKVHLFPAMDEPDHLASGETRRIVTRGEDSIALSTCFDLRFPVMYRSDALDGANIFAVCSEWPASRATALRALAVARALENQAYLALCNRCGVASDGTAFGGGSAIIDPMGAVVAELGEDEGVVRAAIESESVANLRAKFPVLSLERAEIYAARVSRSDPVASHIAH